MGAYLTFAWLLFRRPPTELEVAKEVQDARLLRKVSEIRRREAEMAKEEDKQIAQLLHWVSGLYLKEAWKGNFQQELFFQLLERRLARDGEKCHQR